MKITPYLNFDGQCAEAFRFYQSVLGGHLEILSHEDSPIAAEVPDDWGDRTMHAYLAVGDVELMGSDTPPGQYTPPGDFYVSIHVDDVDEGERIFSALTEEGQVRMPYEPTFWATRFGMLVDRFGTPWMVNVAREPAEVPEAS